MSFLKQKAKPFLFACTLLSLTTIASCSPPWANQTIDFAFTGQVLDYDTKQPIEGAYALAVYQKVEIGLGGRADYCYKTKGMYTGKDGKFSFPMEKPTSFNPDIVYAIKPDYFTRDTVIPTPTVQKAQTKEAYTNRHVYLKKQDPAKPEFQFGDGECSRPESAQAAEASIQFLEFERAELIRFGSQFYWFKNSMETMDRRIKRLQSAPDKK